jgi:hypothetical protein
LRSNPSSSKIEAANKLSAMNFAEVSMDASSDKENVQHE